MRCIEMWGLIETAKNIQLSKSISEIAIKYYTTHGVPVSMIRETVSEKFGEEMALMVFGK